MGSVWVTGVGIVSAAGSSAADVLSGQASQTDWSTFAPYGIRPVVGFDPERYVPKRGDRRAMSSMMLYAVDAAAQALEGAGILGDAALLGETGLLVAAGMSDRDTSADAALLEAARGDDQWVRHNAAMQEQLRPTLFLAQLPNLVAGNISILLGVSGMSRTLMGEEMAGAECIRLGIAQIAGGQRRIMLVGGCFSAERPEVLASYAAAGLLSRSDGATREAGMVIGSGAAFLVLEDADHARRRGARPYGQVVGAATGRADRSAVGPAEQAWQQWQSIVGEEDSASVALVGGANGSTLLADEERAFADRLAATTDRLVEHRSATEMFGHLIDASAPARAVVAAMMLGGASGEGQADRVVCLEWGHGYGESQLVLERVQ